MTTYPTNPMIELFAEQSAQAPAAPPRRISAIDEQMASLRNTQSATLKLLEEMAAKLEPILSAELPVACGVGPGEPSVSQLHGEVMERAKVADDTHARIRRLIERVTV